MSENGEAMNQEWSIEKIVQTANEYAFQKPLVVNNLRAIIVEAMLSLTLSPDWRWCSQDWSGWDFEHSDGTKLEVKQSAARQTWSPPKRPQDRTFDIAPRTGYYEGSSWKTVTPRRFADVYVFGFHPLLGGDADHRDAAQWEFYTLAERQLPKDRRTLTLRMLRTMTGALKFSELRDSIELLRKTRTDDQKII